MNTMVPHDYPRKGWVIVTKRITRLPTVEELPHNKEMVLRFNGLAGLSTWFGQWLSEWSRGLIPEGRAARKGRTSLRLLTYGTDYLRPLSEDTRHRTDDSEEALARYLGTVEIWIGSYLLLPIDDGGWEVVKLPPVAADYSERLVMASVSPPEPETGGGEGSIEESHVRQRTSDGPATGSPAEVGSPVAASRRTGIDENDRERLAEGTDRHVLGGQGGPC